MKTDEIRSAYRSPKILHEFSIGRIDWEMDNHAWVAETGTGERKLFMTNHDRLYEASVAELVEEIENHKAWLAGMERALSLMGGE